MLKMYHRHAEAGSSAAYWEDFGGGSTLADHLRFCEIDPLRPLFERFLKPGSVMLEGGCGRGQYVAYYGARGAKVIGLDFARQWLTAAHAECPSLMLCAGDVGALPFADGAFDVYYSGGVVEHFEGGADRALAEARRVLKRDGVLLLSVPYFSPLRRALSALGRREWRRVAGPDVDHAANGHLRFYQYAYTVPEFTSQLSAAGFRVLDTQGYAIVWGLYDVGVIQHAAARFERRHRGPAKAGELGPAKAGHYVPSRVGEGPAEAGRYVRSHVASDFSRSNGSQPSLLKRLLVSEDATVPGAGWLVRAARRTCANMMMYVCVPSLTARTA